jgi:sec-independent protein translocase protein TatA
VLNGFGWPHLLIIAVLLIVLFGAKRLPGAAKGIGQSLKIFKSEVRGMHDDEAAPPAPTFAPPSAQNYAPTGFAQPQQFAQPQLAPQPAPAAYAEPVAQPVAQPAAPMFQQPVAPPVAQPVAEPVAQQPVAPQPVVPVAQPVAPQPPAGTEQL